MKHHHSVVLPLCRALSLLAFCCAARAQTSPATQPLSQIEEPTRVTLRLQKVPLKEAFDRLEQVSKLHLQSAQPQLLKGDDRTVTADFHEAAYLTALIEICRQGNVQINTVGSRLMLLPGSGRKLPPSSAAGPLMVFCNNVDVSHEIDFGTHDRATHWASFSCTIVGEPVIPLVSVEGPPLDVVAVDDRGNRLLPYVFPVAPTLIDGMMENRFFSVNVAIDSTTSGTISSLTGSVVARVIGKSGALTIKDLLGSEGAVVAFGDSTFKVARVEQAGPPGQYQVDLEVKSAALSAGFFGRMTFGEMQFAPRLEPAGSIVRLTSVQPAAVGGKGDGLTLTLLVALKGAADKAPVSLVWPLPMELRRVRVPFEFHNLQLR